MTPLASWALVLTLYAGLAWLICRGCSTNTRSQQVDVACDCGHAPDLHEGPCTACYCPGHHRVADVQHARSAELPAALDAMLEPPPFDWSAAEAEFTAPGRHRRGADQ